MSTQLELIGMILVNAFIQRNMGEVTLRGKKVLCVSLDRTCTFEGEGEKDIILDDEELSDLIGQTLGQPPVLRHDEIGG